MADTETPNDPQPGTPEYDQKMASLADNVNVQESKDSFNSEDTQGEPKGEDNQEGDLILGKFKSYEDLEKSYKELEKKLGDPNRNKEPDVSLERAGEESKESTEDPKDPKDEPSPFEQVAREYAEKGTFSDEAKETLSKQGVTPEMLSVYEAGLKSLQQERVNAAIKAVGGEEQFEAIRQWAGQTLSDGEFQAFNKNLQQAQTPEEIGLVYETLANRYNKVNQGEPTRIQGNATKSTSAGGFTNKAELAEAMNDPKYRNDGAYRKQVEAKLGATDFSTLR